MNLNRTSRNLEPGFGPRFSKFAELDLRSSPGFAKFGPEPDPNRTAATLDASQAVKTWLG